MPVAAEKVDQQTPEQVTPTRSLVRKLAEVMGEVARIPKSGRNEFHRYDYATEADIVSAVRQGMAVRHVMMFPSITNLTWREVPGKQGPQKVCTLHVEFTFADGDSGETQSLMAVGEGQDQGDKATYKALTGATKYALMKTFLIPTGDDPEDDGQPAKRGGAQVVPMQQRTEPPPPPLSQQVAATQTEKVKAAVKAKLAPKGGAPANDHHAAIRRLFADHNISEPERIRSIIKGATGKTAPTQLDRDDVARVQDALLAMSRMTSDFDGPPPSENA